MWIERDLFDHFRVQDGLECLYLKGPRQTGKTSLLTRLEPKPRSLLFFDDPNLRERARQDPEFVLSQAEYPVLIDEAHLAPEIFSSMKKRIDESRRRRIESPKMGLEPASFRVTGSNLTEVNRFVRESLAGRVNIHFLHGLSWNEIARHDPAITLGEYAFRGGFPELWVRREINPIAYLNDYVSTFLEKDLARSIGIEKRNSFLQVLRLLAARVGELLNYESLGNDADVAGKTVKQWVSLLEENRIVQVLTPYSSNLNQRLIKMPKAYFIDLGLCARLQSHQAPAAIFNSAQARHLFENLVVSEAVKAKDHFRKDWNLHFWRTKDGEEIDLVLETASKIVLIEIKLGSTSSRPIETPKALRKTGKEIRCIVVTATGDRHRISPSTECVPLTEWARELRSIG